MKTMLDNKSKVWKRWNKGNIDEEGETRFEGKISKFFDQRNVWEGKGCKNFKWLSYELL